MTSSGRSRSVSVLTKFKRVLGPWWEVSAHLLNAWVLCVIANLCIFWDPSSSERGYCGQNLRDVCIFNSNFFFSSKFDYFISLSEPSNLRNTISYLHMCTCFSFFPNSWLHGGKWFDLKNHFFFLKFGLLSCQKWDMGKVCFSLVVFRIDCYSRWWQWDFTWLSFLPPKILCFRKCKVIDSYFYWDVYIQRHT